MFVPRGCNLPTTRLKPVNLQDSSLHARSYKLHGYMLQAANYMATRLPATSDSFNSLVAPRGPADLLGLGKPQIPFKNDPEPRGVIFPKYHPI